MNKKSNIKTPEEIDLKIIDLYKSGNSVNAIINIFNLSKSKIYSVLRKYKIKQNFLENKLKRNSINKNHIVNEYNLGISYLDIAKKYSISKATIKNILLENFIQIRNVSKTRLNKNGIDENIFNDPKNNHAAYWIGFIATDGNLSSRNTAKKNKTYTISIELKKSDIEHLIKFKKFSNSGNAVKTYKRFVKNTNKLYESCQIGISSKIIFNKLMEYGLTPKKSLTCNVTNSEILNNPNFIRGCIDGDGSIGLTSKIKHTNRYPKFSYCGSFEMVNNILIYINKYIFETNNEPAKRNKIFEISFVCQKAYKIIKHLYGDAEIYLDRKYELAQQIISDFKDSYDKE